MSDINIFITSDLTASERRISPQWDLKYFKNKLELITGIPQRYQTIQRFEGTSDKYDIISDAKNYAEEKDSNILLLQIGIIPYSRLHIVDTNPDSQLSLLQDDEDKDKTFRFELPEYEYAKRTDSVLSWKRAHKLGRFDPELISRRSKREEENYSSLPSLEIGKRCRVISILGERRGTVRFVGKIPSLDDDLWVGVQFDEPVGKNDGSLDGVKYFDSKQNHGSFVKPKSVEAGDFPPLGTLSDTFTDEDIDNDEEEEEI